MKKIPMLDLAKQQASLSPDLERCVQEVMLSTRYLPDKWPSAFESQLAAYCQRPFVVGVGSGSAALHLALLAAKVGPGDEVVTVPNSFFATTEAILVVGARPVFVDVDPATHLMDIARLEAVVGPRTKAVLPVHLFGNVVDVGAIESCLARCGRSDVIVIEDCAHAAGAALGQRPVPIGRIGAFSFNPGKNIGALGDAGAIVTSDEGLARQALLLRDHGRASKNEHLCAGFNSRLRCIDDTVLGLKLRHLDAWNEQRRQHAAVYDRAFAGTSVRPIQSAPNVRNAMHQYVIRTPAREAVKAALSAAHIDSAVHYPRLIVDQPPLSFLDEQARALPVARELGSQMLSLPCFPELAEDDVHRIIDVVLSSASAAGQSSR